MAQARDNFRGPNGKDVALSNIIKDTRSTKEKLSDFIGTPDGFVTILGICFSLFIIIPSFGELWAIISSYIIYFASKKEFRLPFRLPKTSGLIDPGQINPGTDQPELAEGITFFGNERITQKELWFNNSDMRTHVLIFGSTGAGKALRKKELIHTPNGWKKNEELKVGDLVSTPFGNSPIIGVYPQGELELYKITFEDGREIEVSGDHLWEVHYKGWSKKEIAKNIFARAKVINTEKLMAALNKKKLNNNYYIPLSKEVIKPEVNLPINPYILGTILADGTIANKNIRFSSSDKEITEKLNSLMPEDFTLNKLSGRQETEKNLNESIFKELQCLNLIGTNSFNKFIPDIYKNGSIEQRYDLVNGLMDKNGLAYKGRIEFTTTSISLAKDLVEVIQSLGGVVKIEEKQISYLNNNEKKLGSISYELHIRFPEPKKLFSLERKIKNVETYQYKDTLKLKIISVVKTENKEDCQCIKIADKRGLFITKDYIVTHNTESLLSLAYNSLVQGSGLIYVDGKGENVLYTKVFSMARTMGREDDVLCINYMTGSRDVFGPQEKKLSNTLNPFSSGGSGGLTELLVSLMDDGGGGGDMWKGRAISLISAIMMALTYMRDKKEILLDASTIREYLILDNIIKLYKTRRDFPNHIRNALKGYLVSLPGFQESAPKQNDTVGEQHGYLQMQFTKLLGSLSDQYGFIFNTNLGEVDFKDVVLNRRILVVLLPALEKSTDELANLGKIIVACLKQMMAQALGATVEGTYAEVVETKPTNSPVPFMTVLDEYGYYAVKGSAVMPAQARSLGFSMIFAGQDLPAFEKASKEEAASIVANCNIKICMKLEDPKDTYDLFEKSAAETSVVVDGKYERIDGQSGIRQSGGGSVETRKRINILDLKEQAEGEAHIIFKSALVRAKMFYAFTPKPPKITMNYFVRVEPPDVEVITQMDNGLKSLIKNVANENKIKELEENLELENMKIDMLRSLLDEHSSYKMSEAAFATIAALGNEIYSTYDEKINNFNKASDDIVDDDDEKEEEINVFSNKKDREKYIEERYSILSKNKKNEDETDNDDDEDDEDDDMDEDEDINVFIEERKTRKDFEDIEKMIGSSDDEARDAASRTIEDMKKVSSYPNEGKPSEKDPEEIIDILNELDEMFDTDTEDE